MSNQNPWIAISDLLQSVESKFTKSTGKQFGPHNLTLSQVNILLLLDKNGTMKVSDIADELPP